MDKCPENLIKVAHALADASAQVITQYFRTDPDTEKKEDLSPVTIADRKAEAAMRALLAQERPQDGIIGEEFGNENEDADYVWVLDPIDGTRAFAAGKPIFGTLIALLYKGKPVLGLINQPITQECWVGAIGHTTTLNDKPCQARNCKTMDLAVSCMGSQAFPHDKNNLLNAYRQIDEVSQTTTVGGDCYSYGLVASGHIDLVIEHGLKLYDFAALVPVVEGAGGVICDWQGQPLTKDSAGQVIATGSQEIMNEAIELLKGAL